MSKRVTEVEQKTTRAAILSTLRATYPTARVHVSRTEITLGDGVMTPRHQVPALLARVTPTEVRETRKGRRRVYLDPSEYAQVLKNAGFAVRILNNVDGAVIMGRSA